jgi:hypothetical protein
VCGNSAAVSALECKCVVTVVALGPAVLDRLTEGDCSLCLVSATGVL